MRVWSIVFALTLLAGSADAAFINPQTKELNLKIVYCGAPSAELAELVRQTFKLLDQKRADPARKGKLSGAGTDTERVLWFDFVPRWLGPVQGHTVRLHLYSCPGPSFAASRRLILKGLDGLVFVAGDDAGKERPLVAAWQGLRGELAGLGYPLAKVPLVVQLEERAGATRTLGAARVRQLLGLPTAAPLVAAATGKGSGLLAVVEAIAKQVVASIKP